MKMIKFGIPLSSGDNKKLEIAFNHHVQALRQDIINGYNHQTAEEIMIRPWIRGAEFGYKLGFESGYVEASEAAARQVEMTKIVRKQKRK